MVVSLMIFPSRSSCRRHDLLNPARNQHHEYADICMYMYIYINIIHIHVYAHVYVQNMMYVMAMHGTSGESRDLLFLFREIFGAFFSKHLLIYTKNLKVQRYYDTCIQPLDSTVAVAFHFDVTFAHVQISPRIFEALSVPKRFAW